MNRLISVLAFAILAIAGCGTSQPQDPRALAGTDDDASLLKLEQVFGIDLPKDAVGVRFEYSNFRDLEMTLKARMSCSSAAALTRRPRIKDLLIPRKHWKSYGLLGGQMIYYGWKFGGPLLQTGTGYTKKAPLVYLDFAIAKTGTECVLFAAGQG